MTEMADYPAEPVKVEDSTFDQFVQRYSLAVIDCWAPWCGPCRMVAPVLDELAAESSGRYVIAKLNVDENPKTAARFGIRSIPTIMIFKNGQLVDTLIGAQPKQSIAARLARAA